MLEKAIEKIKAEMDKNKGDDFVPSIGEFLIYYLGINPLVAEKILDPGKTILKSVEELWKAAEKKRKGKGAALSSQEWSLIVLNYFGIEGTTITPVSMSMPISTPIATSSPTPTPINVPNPIDVVLAPTVPLNKTAKTNILDFNIDDFF